MGSDKRQRSALLLLSAPRKGGLRTCSTMPVSFRRFFSKRSIDVCAMLKCSENYKRAKQNN